MHLIFTHEQADFDAIAALGAANFLDPAAQAVLPRRLNRNVRAFLTLYDEELPFVEYRDLSDDPIERITVVDTQSLPSVKGIRKETEIVVIDHHPLGEDLDPTWSTHIEAIGATTTLLVEVLDETGMDLDFVSATLLLIGIYEDTGSLSYASTTSRDVRACAWLIDCGANLSIANEFLNHPLSDNQRRLYDRLLEASESIELQGVSIVFSHARAHDLVDEVSSLAHKLRDVFDPDVLIVLVGLDGNVQLVARSTSTALDVGDLAERYGGGGHNRAAAALIRDRDIQELRDEILKLLPSLIQPARTVGEIMSRDPQVLDPEVKVTEAAERMQRFGHEGYPVVESGKVVGLLTRRAVDRAMSHGMVKEPVSAIMDAGHLIVSPTDSVQHLQRSMIQQGWGQVPVGDPKTGEIIGIVTRTDLLKILGEELAEAPVTPVAERLEQALPPPRLALLKLVSNQAELENDALYIVGGFVRDLILKAPSVDFDLVVEGDAIRLAKALASSYGGKVSSHRRFGTAKWSLEMDHPKLLKAVGREQLSAEDLPESLDFVSARTEFYTHPTALPSVHRGNIKLDLHRRDFTVNTMALRLDGRYYGQILDPWGGGRDIREGRIRVLHSISFVDDPTRILRAVRLEQRLGFTIGSRTLELLEQAVPLLDRVSGERIRHELETIFRERNVDAIMTRLLELGLLQAIHEDLTWDAWLEARFDESAEFTTPENWRISRQPGREFIQFALMLFRLPTPEAREVSVRLRFPASVAEQFIEANRTGKDLIDLPKDSQPSEIVSTLVDRREWALVASWVGLADHPRGREALERYLAEWRFVSPFADGDTLRSRELPPGPAYRSILWALRTAWLDGKIRNEGEEKVMLDHLIAEARSNG